MSQQNQDQTDKFKKAATSGRQWIRDAGLALIITPIIMFGILIYGAFTEPGLLLDHWDVYMPFVAMPWAVGAVLLWRAARHNPVEKAE